MPRRRIVAKRVILPDPKLHSEFLGKFINSIMRNGKKAVAEKIVYDALERVRAHLKGRSIKAAGEINEHTSSEYSDDDSLLEAFEQALSNIQPSVEVRARRVGGATYQIPVEVRPSRRMTLARRWLRAAAAQRSEKTMAQRLAAEILDAYDKKGIAYKKCEDTYRMAKANQALAHFRWS